MRAALTRLAWCAGLCLSSSTTDSMTPYSLYVWQKLFL